MNLSKKDIRLILELAKLQIPLRHVDTDILAAWIKDEMNFDITEESIKGVKPFKQILFRKIITGVKNVANGGTKVKTMRVLKERSHR